MGAEAVLPTPKPPAIFGVTSDAENVVMALWPSMAATWWGRLLGRLYDCIPLKINGVKLSNLLFTLPTIPITLAGYLLMKLFGERYVLTNRSIARWSSLTPRLIAQMPLGEIASIEIVRRPGQAFYHAADLELLDRAGNRLLVLAGVPRADVFRQTILKARDARAHVESSLATINARHAT